MTLALTSSIPHLAPDRPVLAMGSKVTSLHIDPPVFDTGDTFRLPLVVSVGRARALNIV
jgi:hypothetical protein